jgi:hypothetical protein
MPRRLHPRRRGWRNVTAVVGLYLVPGDLVMPLRLSVVTPRRWLVTTCLTRGAIRMSPARRETAGADAACGPRGEGATPRHGNRRLERANPRFLEVTSFSTATKTTQGVLMTPSITNAPALPGLPARFDRSGLTAAGFIGWQTWADLRSHDYRQVPHASAVYVAYRDTSAPAEFLDANPGGRFKGKDPTVIRADLISNWVSGAHVVYIGKADVADRRLEQFGRFGAGEPIGHWGGRLIWQLSDSGALRLAWHEITWSEDARTYEKRLLAHFAAHHLGKRPFANLTG